MPVINKAQIERMVSLCGASLPEKFARITHKYENNKEALFDAGMVYAINQVVELLTHDVDGNSSLYHEQSSCCQENLRWNKKYYLI